ncbi:SWIM zinc finger family protein [Sphingobacterium siyangense]|uniref:SWIM zinc finger family protein n=1 Tax=Sphingobacterium siyangense TaxID=459529 RepID=UPI002FDD7F63
MVPVIRISQAVSLPDTDQWQLRFEVESETSNRVYVIAQNKKKKHWGCSCPGWRRNRTCKHLAALGIPGKEQPFEINIIKE